MCEDRNRCHVCDVLAKCIRESHKQLDRIAGAARPDEGLDERVKTLVDAVIRLRVENDGLKRPRNSFL
jgi:hypothetical protein